MVESLKFVLQWFLLNLCRVLLWMSLQMGVHDYRIAPFHEQLLLLLYRPTILLYRCLLVNPSRFSMHCRCSLLLEILSYLTNDIYLNVIICLCNWSSYSALQPEGACFHFIEWLLRLMDCLTYKYIYSLKVCHVTH